MKNLIQNLTYGNKIVAAISCKGEHPYKISIMVMYTVLG